MMIYVCRHFRCVRTFSHLYACMSTYIHTYNICYARTPMDARLRTLVGVTIYHIRTYMYVYQIHMYVCVCACTFFAYARSGIKRQAYRQTRNLSFIYPSRVHHLRTCGTHIHTYVCMYIQMARIYIRMYLCTSVCTYVHTYAYVRYMHNVSSR